MPTVSVIVPTYNNARFIESAIRSITSQTVPVKEIIVIDDGSTDNTAEILASIPEDKLLYRRFDNAGASAARNRGLELASGDFVAFLDADDVWRPTMIEKQLAALSSDRQIVCSFTNFIRFENSTGKLLRPQFDFYPELDNMQGEVIPNAFPTLVMFGEIPAFTQVMMFRRDATSDLRFDPTLRICEDMAFALRVFSRGKVAFIRDVLAEVRLHERNSSRGHLSMMSLHKLTALLSIDKHVKEAHRREFRERLVKAFIDASLDAVAAGNVRNGLAYLSKAVRAPGTLGRKGKGAMRFALSVAKTAFVRGDRAKTASKAASTDNPQPPWKSIGR